MRGSTSTLVSAVHVYTRTGTVRSATIWSWRLRPDGAWPRREQQACAWNAHRLLGVPQATFVARPTVQYLFEGRVGAALVGVEAALAGVHNNAAGQAGENRPSAPDAWPRGPEEGARHESNASPALKTQTI